MPRIVDKIMSAVVSATDRAETELDLPVVEFDDPVVEPPDAGMADCHDRTIHLNPRQSVANSVKSIDDSAAYQKSVPRPKSGFVNLGNTCYLNATIQALFSLPSFRHFLLPNSADSNASDCQPGLGTHSQAKCRQKFKSETGLAMSCMICILGDILSQSIESPGRPLRPLAVYNKLRRICKHMVHGRQEDAHEFLRYLIEDLHKSFVKFVRPDVHNGLHLPLATPQSTAEKQKGGHSPLNELFDCFLSSQVTCHHCRHVSTTRQRFMDWQLSVKGANSIAESVEAYFQPEQIGTDRPTYKCDKCHRKVIVTRRTSIDRPPAVLCLHLNRFASHHAALAKITKQIRLADSLDLAPFLADQAERRPLTYRLASVINHVGCSVNSGHYTAIGGEAGGQFFEFDDASVRRLSDETAFSGRTAYVVFYEMTSEARSSWLSSRSLSGASVVKRKVEHDISDKTDRPIKVCADNVQSLPTAKSPPRDQACTSDCGGAKMAQSVANQTNSKPSTVQPGMSCKGQSEVTQRSPQPEPEWRPVDHVKTFATLPKSNQLPLASSDKPLRSDDSSRLKATCRRKSTWTVRPLWAPVGNKDVDDDSSSGCSSASSVSSTGSRRSEWRVTTIDPDGPSREAVTTASVRSPIAAPFRHTAFGLVPADVDSYDAVDAEIDKGRTKRQARHWSAALDRKRKRPAFNVAGDNPFDKWANRRPLPV